MTVLFSHFFFQQSSYANSIQWELPVGSEACDYLTVCDSFHSIMYFQLLQEHKGKLPAFSSAGSHNLLISLDLGTDLLMSIPHPMLFRATISLCAGCSGLQLLTPFFKNWSHL